MRRLSRVLSLVGILFLVPTLGHAAPQDGGCSVIQVGLGGGCRYLSHGPGVYSAGSVSGFRIQACALADYDLLSGACAGAWRWIAGAAPSATSGVSVIAGPLDTRADEVVELSVSIVSLVNPQDSTEILRYQDGFVGAHDLPPGTP